MVTVTERRETAVNSIDTPTFSPPDLKLQAKTDAGKRLVELAERHAADFATRAGEHDRDGSYAYENIEALQESGFLYAAAPEELGGMGVGSYHDLLVAASRLAQGDPAIAIGVNMHVAGLASMAHTYRQAVASGHQSRVKKLGFAIRAMAQGKQVVAAGVSEPAQDLTRPSTTAVRTENGWRINGTKIFCTMSPASTSLFVAVTHQNADGEDTYSFALVPTNTPGVIINDDWDALGMRSSGSNSVTLKDVDVPQMAVIGGWKAGHVTPEMLENFLPYGLFHASASLGIAESAHATVVESLAKKRKDGHVAPHTLITASQNAIDLFASRAALAHAANLADEFYSSAPANGVALDVAASYFADVQSAKTLINEASQRIVDRALTLSGGAGYMNKHPLSRAYRDVRAGAFMHPLGANRAYEFIGQVTLGLVPALT
jgi:alkylation response protein AidB-like acyl-CoA dehydrogenase